MRMHDIPLPAPVPELPDPDGSVTQLLRVAGRGDPRVQDALFARVYDELHRLARRIGGGRAGETLCTTVLVHEAYLKLVRSAQPGWDGRAHFFGAAARAMRQILVSEARRRCAQKRGDWAVTFEEGEHAAPVQPEELLALDAALERLGALEPRRALVVEHRFFAGLTTEETARLLDVSTATVERDWRSARAWLAQQLGDATPP